MIMLTIVHIIHMMVCICSEVVQMNHNNMSREGKRHGGGQENIGRCTIKNCNFQLYQDVCICPAKYKKTLGQGTGIAAEGKERRLDDMILKVIMRMEKGGEGGALIEKSHFIFFFFSFSFFLLSSLSYL